MGSSPVRRSLASPRGSRLRARSPPPPSPLPRPRRRRRPIVSTGVPSLPAYDGAPATAHEVDHADDRRAEPVHGAEPELEHPQRHLDDRRLPAPRAARQLAGDPVRGRSSRRSAARSPSTAGGGSSPSARRSRSRRSRGSSTRTPWRRSPSTTLPDAPDPPGTHEYQNFSGGGYFFLDDEDRIWVPTKTNHIFVLGQTRRRQRPRAAARLRPHRRPRRRRPSGWPRRCPTSTA